MRQDMDSVKITCRACSTPKDRAAFSTKPNGRVRMPCRACRRAARKPLTASQKVALKEYTRRWRASLVASGLCITCKEQAATSLFCLHHWFQGIGRPHGLTVKNGGLELIKLIWEEQRGLCALTGEVLVPGVNASLDHITPVSQGGTNAKDNLRWVLLEVNEAKAGLLDTDFIAMCRKVVKALEQRVPDVR